MSIGAVEEHVRRFFAGHQIRVIEYDVGARRRTAVPELRIIEVGPGPRVGCWSYVTAGCRPLFTVDGHGVEFVMTAPVASPRVVDLLAMIAFYHSSEHLDHWHGLPIGEPWLPGSACVHLLMSQPFLHGPDLEECLLPDGHARILWALPITAAEAAFRREQGTEALEELFDEAAIDPNDPLRASVV